MIDRFDLMQNYPNPFNLKTVIEFYIPKSQFVKISVYDILGEEKEIIVNNYLMAGKHKVLFDGSTYASGVYLYTISTNDYSETKELLLLK